MIWKASVAESLKRFKYYETLIATFVLIFTMVTCTSYIGHVLRQSQKEMNEADYLQLQQQRELKQIMGDFQNKTLVIRLNSLEERLTSLQATEEMKTQLYRQMVEAQKKRKKNAE